MSTLRVLIADPAANALGLDEYRPLAVELRRNDLRRYRRMTWTWVPCCNRCIGTEDCEGRERWTERRGWTLRWVQTPGRAAADLAKLLGGA